MTTGWTPFQRASLIIPPAEELSREQGIPLNLAQRLLEEMQEDIVWINNRYQVNIRKARGLTDVPMLHLSIKRLDKKPIHDWRDLQRIKTELVGPENEGLELYPAESRLVDTANQFHLWVFTDPRARVPIGFFDGRRVTDTNLGNAKQRPLEGT